MTPLSESRVELRVFYADTDQMGVVYYANYLKWFEAGRANYLRQRGISYRQIEENGFLLPVAESYCRYLAPARYDDIIEVQARVIKVGRATVKFHYRITRKEDGRELATGYTQHFCQDKEGKISRLPAFLSDILQLA